MIETDDCLRTLQAGVGRIVITPPVGIRMQGYTVQECVSESVEQDLTATALVLSDGNATVILIACDILFIQSPHVDRMRTRIGFALDIPTSNVLINASHTHLGPMLPGWQIDSPEQELLQQNYVAWLEDALIGAAAVATGRLQPARIGSARGSAPIGINRRETLANGKVIIGENANGAIDDEIGVIRIDDLDGKPITTIMIGAAHTIVLGPRTSQLSPDYVGPARKIVETATGAPSLFFQGAAGNISPRCGIGAGGPAQYDDLHRIGTMLGGEVLKNWSQIRTHNQRGPRRIVQSVATLSTWDYEPLPDASIRNFRVADRRLNLATAALPDRSEIEALLPEYESKLREATAARHQGNIHVYNRLIQWAQLVLRTIDTEKPVTRDLYCWAFRVNDIAIVAVNGEPFAELSLEVKRQSPIASTFFLGYSNGCLGYLPTPEAFDEGGMEVNESFRNYMLPTAFTREWGPAVVSTSLDLLRNLSRNAS